MPIRKQVKCAVCGQTILTLSGAMFMAEAPVVCRRCFGHQTYNTPSERATKVVTPVGDVGGTG